MRGRRTRAALWAALGTGTVLAVLIAVLASSHNASDVASATPLAGKPAPEIAGVSLDGPDVRLSSLRGRWVLVDFFASWCIPCQREQPDLVRFAQRHAADVAVLSVRYDDPDDGPVRSLMQRSGAHWPVVDDSEAKVAYGVTGVPENFLVDPSGIVLGRLFSVSADQLDTLLTRAKAAEAGPAARSGSAPPAGASGAGPAG